MTVLNSAFEKNHLEETEEFDLKTIPLKGTNLIEASAGTGKTFTIAGIFLRLIVEKGFRIDEILVVTFTKAATEELRRRIRIKLRMALDAIEGKEIDDEFVSHIMSPFSDGDKRKIRQRIITALKSFDEASVYTIHSFCQQVLVDNAFESGSLFNMELSTNSRILSEKLVKDFWRLKLYGENERIIEIITKHRSPDEWLRLYLKRPLDPEAKIAPHCKEINFEEINKIYERLDKFVCDLKKEWNLNGEEVKDIFKNSPAFKRNIYKPDKMDERLLSMDDYVKFCRGLPLFEGFEFFTSKKIESSIKESFQAPVHSLFKICDEILSLSNEIQNFASSVILSYDHEVLDYMSKEMQRRKSESNIRSFDDLIRDVHTSTCGNNNQIIMNVSGRYKAALIDEFQDTDQLQFDIFNRIFNNDSSILFLIGDPKQAIYRFRGADVFSYIRASKLMKNRYTLHYNWRSTPELIESVNTLFGRCKSPFLSDDILFKSVSPGNKDQSDSFIVEGKKCSGLAIRLVDDNSNGGKAYNKAKATSIIIASICDEISRIIGTQGGAATLGDKPVKPGDIAVLVRKHHLAENFQDELGKLNIPSVIRGGQTIFSTEDALEVYFILLAISEPLNDRYIRTAMTTRIMGYTGEEVVGIFSESSDSQNVKAFDIVKSFFNYREIWSARGIMDMFNLFIADKDVTRNMFKLGSGDRRVTNLYHIIEILHREEKNNRYSISELLFWMKSCIVERLEDDDFILRLEKDEEAVKIITMHSSKGLEFPVVFCPMFVENPSNKDKDVFTYHDPDNDGRPVMYISKDIPDDIEKKRSEENLAENIRLMYVALTRAKSKCYLYTANGTSYKKSSMFYIFSGGEFASNTKVDCNLLTQMLSSIAKESGQTIDFSLIGEKEGRVPSWRETKREIPKLYCKEWLNPSWNKWRMWSYSSIVNSMSYEEKDIDRLNVSSELKHSGGEDIFSFPAGARAGLCIHEIFENIDFAFTEGDEFIKTVFDISCSYGFDEKWVPHLIDMIKRVVNTPLDNEGHIYLSRVGKECRLNELEFYFPSDLSNTDLLRKVLKSDPVYGKYLEKSLVNETSLIGYMKGFVDLIFEYDGKYYIIDWKSNRLGYEYEDYDRKCIDQEMSSHHYFLQYYVYSLALHRYLSFRLGDSYSYDDSFGGVFYLFVRGMTGEPSKRYGIFDCKPSVEIILEMDKCFSGKGK